MTFIPVCHEGHEGFEGQLHLHLQIYGAYSRFFPCLPYVPCNSCLPRLPQLIIQFLELVSLPLNFI